ncbi:uncharacterized protein PGTG_09888 [Puccinia graminis f. sp. tritici CRL 75-36-700-3]|uniref:Uncharacterized protein n=1 Tax=Puccinia graminis f. sp. tritici (strain CRL 75-36-700-3 / race SCCL) TaxID=418459 RepID=E3KF93_PUCGT|nr:uncharacterized protein PGTG_09888 [Puccinia graminis f. sp. tritici CRL 75-36-700-3]EFP82920.1 hypothetical protein PGTG_09888 [Puccinia graminis f. sp. tritici CRL 75-36-700-3]
MSLPFSTPDLEDGFAPLTPFRNRIFDQPSGSSSTFNWNTETTLPPPKDKGKGKASEIQDITEEDSDSGDITPQKQNLPPLSGYGLHNTQNADEPVYNRQQQQQPANQQPIPQVAPRIINEPGLFYDGENFGTFLKRFEQAARAFNATDYDKALQIGRFMKTEELKIQLEAMDGFEKCEWVKLRKEMVETWGELDNTILYTTNDLVDITKEYGVNGGIKDHREFKLYLGKFTTILKYLVTNKQIHQKSDASILFLSAFSRESQMNIKRTLISYELLPKGPDGSNLPPRWEDLVEASRLEVRIVEPGYFNISGFGESNQLMQNKLNAQKGNSQRRDQMIAEAPTGKAMDKQVDEMAREIASLKSQLKSIIPVSYNQSGSNEKSEFSRGNAKPSTPLYKTQACYYCKREGLTTYRCPELAQDEDLGLVKRTGRDWYLPDGQHIPWNPSRPIRTVVATASADPKMQEAAKKLAESRRTGKTQTPTTIKTSAQTIDWDPPQLGADNFLVNHTITRSEAQRGRRSVWIQEPERDAMDVDQEDEISEIAEETPKTPVVEKVWSKEKPVNKVKAATPEEALLQELDHLKIPTTFAQLTAISPTYTEQIIAKLQNRLPGKSSATYITTETAKVSAAMTGVDNRTPTPMAHANPHARRRLACGPARQSAAGELACSWRAGLHAQH